LTMNEATKKPQVFTNDHAKKKQKKKKPIDVKRENLSHLNLATHYTQKGFIRCLTK